MGLLRDDGGEGRPSSARDVRARPDQLPPAGVTVLAGRPQQGGLPWDEGHGRLGARHYAAEAQTRAEAVWTAQYEKPTFGRRRAPDLMATGPSMRAATGPVGGGRQRPASAHRAQFAGPTYDTATMVSSTTTATNLRRPY
ncbi:unnamed protein product [Pedinophyceae sp. YPF-701]|nr:unnamed protein product [Pedinophyceae sp. YPF-701]